MFPSGQPKDMLGVKMKRLLIVGNPLFRKNLCSRLTALPSVVSCGYTEAGHEARVLQVGTVVLQVSTEQHIKVLGKLSKGTNNIGGIPVPLWTPAHILVILNEGFDNSLFEKAMPYANKCLADPKTDDVIHAILDCRDPMEISKKMRVSNFNI